MLADAVTDLLTKWFANPGGITGGAVMALGLIGLLRRWIVPGWVYEAVMKDRDQLRADATALLKAYQLREEEERQWREARQRFGLAQQGDD